MVQEDDKLSRPMVVFTEQGERLGAVYSRRLVEKIRPGAEIRWGRYPAAFIRDLDLWLTLLRDFRLSDYMSDDYAYRERNQWSLTPADPQMLPRGVCLDRAEAKNYGVAARDRKEIEADRRAAAAKAGKPFRINRKWASFDGRN